MGRFLFSSTVGQGLSSTMIQKMGVVGSLRTALSPNLALAVFPSIRNDVSGPNTRQASLIARSMFSRVWFIMSTSFEPPPAFLTVHGTWTPSLSVAPLYALKALGL